MVVSKIASAVRSITGRKASPTTVATQYGPLDVSGVKIQDAIGVGQKLGGDVSTQDAIGVGQDLYRSGVRSAGSGTGTPAPVYTSDLLKQSFASREAMERAEAMEKARVAQEKAREQQLARQTAKELRDTARERVSKRIETARDKLRDARDTVIGKLRGVEDRSRTGEIYDPRTGMFISESPTGARATGIMRPPTSEEREAIEQAEYKGDLYGAAIFGLPSQQLPDIINPMATYTKEERELLKSQGYDPKVQWQVFKGKFDAERDLREASKVSDRLEKLNTEWQQEEEKISREIEQVGRGNIDAEGYWIGDEKDLLKYNKLVEQYNDKSEMYEVKFETIEKGEKGSYLRAIDAPERTTYFQEIKQKDIPEWQKIGLTIAAAGSEVGSFFVPAIKVIRGGELATRGVSSFQYAETPKEERKAVLEVGLGTAIAISGLSLGGKAATTKTTATSQLGKTGVLSTIGRVGRTTAVLGAKGGFSYLYGREVARQTDDIKMGIAAGVGAFGVLAAPEIITGAKFTGKAVSKTAKVGFKEFKKTFNQIYKDKRAMAGGTKQKQVQVTKKKLTKEQLKKYLDDLAAEHLEKPGRGEKVTLIKKNLDDLIKRGNKEGIKQYYEFLKRVYGKGEADSLMKEYFAQEGYAVSSRPDVTRTTGITTGRGGEITTGRGGDITDTMGGQITGIRGGDIQVPKKGIIFISPAEADARVVDKTKTDTKGLVITKTKTDTKVITGLGAATKTLSGLKTDAKVIQKQLQNQIQLPLQKQLQKQEQVTRLKILAKQIIKPKTVTKATTQVIKKPTITPPPFTKGFGSALKQIKEKVKDEEFGVFVRKFGEDIEIGKFPTLGQAKTALTQKIRGTLRAGGFITKDDSPILAKELKLFGAEFKPAKSDPFRIIERKERRLKRGTGEITEIQAFRKGAEKKRVGKKIKGNIFGL